MSTDLFIPSNLTARLALHLHYELRALGVSGIDRRNRLLMRLYANQLRANQSVSAFVEVLRKSLDLQRQQLAELTEKIRETEDLDQRRVLLAQALALEDTIEQQLLAVEEMVDAAG